MVNIIQNRGKSDRKQVSMAVMRHLRTNPMDTPILIRKWLFIAFLHDIFDVLISQLQAVLICNEQHNTV